LDDHVDTTRLSEFGGVGVVEQLSVQHQQVTAEPEPILIPHCRWPSSNAQAAHLKSVSGLLDGLVSINSHCLKYSLYWFAIKAGLKLGEQFCGDAGDVLGTAHWKRNALASRVESHLQALGDAFNWRDATSQAHIAEYYHLTLRRPAH